MADNTEIDYDSMSDEDFMNAMDEASVAQPEEEEEIVEDTNQNESTEEEETEEVGTEQDEDESLEDTTDEDDSEPDEEVEGNTQIETSSEAEEETSGSDETETNETPVEEGKETEEVNYEEQYKALLGDNEQLKQFENFYNEVTSEFMANGKKVKGFTDPKKIIESQQMAAGFSDKMTSFSKYKPYMNALRDKGILDDPEKFNLAMNLLDGDQEAIKKHILDLKIDPFELDMENINYDGKNQVSSNLEIAYDDLMESAKTNHVDTQVRDIISRDWDDQSMIALLEDPQSSADLVNHISTGAYDVVQSRIAEKKRVDVNNVYSRQPVIEQYREAAREIEAEHINYMNQQYQQQQQQAQAQVQTEPEIDEQAIQTEMAKIEKERTEDEYKSKVATQNAKADAARKKATSVSKKKPRTNTTKKVFDPGLANDEDFSKYLDSIIYT